MPEGSMRQGQFPVTWPTEGADLAIQARPRPSTAQTFGRKVARGVVKLPSSPPQPRSAHAVWNGLPDGARDWITTGGKADPVGLPPTVPTWYLQSSPVPGGYRGLVQQITWDDTTNPPTNLYDWPLYLLLGPTEDIAPHLGGPVHPQSIYPTFPWLNSPPNSSVAQFNFPGATAAYPLSVPAFGTLECDLWVPANHSFIVAMGNSPSDSWSFSITGWIIPETDLAPEGPGPAMPMLPGHQLPPVPAHGPAPGVAAPARPIRFVTPEDAMGLAMQGWISVRAVPSRADLEAGRSMAMSPPR
ncbi:MAG: hypothetical protein ACYCUI_11605 [Vulcanimicrobiaceae bacterium]